MKSNKLIAIILLLCIMVSVVGCGNPIAKVKSLFEDNNEAVSNVIESPDEIQTDEQVRDTVLYYKDDKGFLIPVMRKIPWTEGIAKATLKALIDNPANRKDIETIGLFPVIPTNTQILGMNIKEGICKVDFNSDFLGSCSRAEEEDLVKSVTYTLTEFPTIDCVQFMVNGKEVSTLEYGTDISNNMTRNNINYVSEGPSEDKVVVYYEGTTNGLESYFIPVTKAVAKADVTGVGMLDALDALVEGPPEGSGLYSKIPKGTKVINVDMNDDVACVNLSEQMLEIEDNKDVAESVSKSFALTLKEKYKNIASVKLFVNGKELKVKDQDTEPVAVPTFANEY